MNKNLRVFSMFLAICALMIGFAIADENKEPPPASVNDNELVKSISEKLSVKPEQAAGGVGSVFNYAKGIERNHKRGPLGATLVFLRFTSCTTSSTPDFSPIATFSEPVQS